MLLDRLPKSALLFITLCFAGVVDSSETSTYWEKLSYIEELRTSDHTNFKLELAKLSKKSNDFSDDEADYFKFLNGISQTMEGKISTAVQTFSQVIANTKNEEIKTRAYLLLVNSYAIDRNWHEGLLTLENLLSEKQKLKDPNLLARTYLTAAIFYNQIGEFNLGIRYSNKVLTEIENISQRSICSALTTKNEALHKSQQGRLSIEEAVKICSTIGESIWANFNRTYLAEAYLSDNQPLETIRLLKEYLHETENTNYSILISEYYRLLAQAYLKLGDFTSAESFANKIIETNFEKVPYKPFVTACEVLYRVERKKGNYQKALEHLENLKNYERQILDETRLQALAIQMAKHRIVEKNSQIEILNKKNEALTLEQELAKKEAQNKTLWLLLLSIITAFFAYWAFRTKRTHVKLRQLAEFDSLTGIANRRHFTQQCEEILNYNCSINQAVSFILFDLDRFKAINDTYGHPVGDWVLQQVPKPVLKIIRKIDVFGRMGGEEFAILLPGCELEKARQIAEDIRKGLMAIEPKEIGHDFQITASFGLTISRVSGYDLDQLMIHSDEALYQAKRAGRNRVCVYSMTPSEQDDASEAEADQTDNN